MRTIYIDSEYRCHTTNLDGAYREFDVSFFYGNCDTFIQGYRYVPSGESWTRPDGVVFTGEMITPFAPYDQLAAAQAQYEADLAEAANAYQEGVDSVWT